MRVTDAHLILHWLKRHPRLVAILASNGGRSLLHPFERQWLDGWSLAPRCLTILVTDTCNFRCPMCQYYFSESSKYRLNESGMMASDVFDKTVDTIAGQPIVSLTGGEPLLHPQIGKYIGRVKARRLLCTITTNGWLLKERAPVLCENGLDALVVSLDGAEETHDRMRKKGSFSRAVDGIKEILRYPNRPFVCIATVITDLNFRDLEKVLTLADHLGVDALHINHLWMQTDKMVSEHNLQNDLPKVSRVQWSTQPEAIDPNQVYDSLKTIQQNRRNVLVSVYPRLNRDETMTYYQRPEQLVKVQETRCAWLVMRVWPNGDVKACRGHMVGNVLEQPLQRIWNGRSFRLFRRSLVQKKVFPICSRCCLLFLRI